MPTLTRDELYALLWSEPVSVVASLYGISDRGLGKLCERNGIPVPPRGWWAKKAAGKRLPKQPPLPPLASGQQARFTFGGPKPAPPSTEPVHEPPEILFERDPANEIAVDSDARVTHPLVRDAGIALRKARPDVDGILHSPRGCIDIRVSRESIQRALAIMQALASTADGGGDSIDARSQAFP